VQRDAVSIVASWARTAGRAARRSGRSMMKIDVMGLITRKLCKEAGVEGWMMETHSVDVGVYIHVWPLRAGSEALRELETLL
jgi:hypothetical protein